MAKGDETNIVNRQDGIALILAIMVLFVLSLLGASALSNSTTEIILSGNQKRGLEAFYAAEAALQRAQVDGSIYGAIGTGSFSADWTIDDGVSAIAGNAASVKVNYLDRGNIPLNASGTDAELFQSDYFVVQATGNGPSGSNSQVTIETQIARVLPK